MNHTEILRRWIHQDRPFIRRIRHRNLWCAGCILYSYATPIAFLYAKHRIAVINNQHYSTTTASHLTKATAAVQERGFIEARIQTEPDFTKTMYTPEPRLADTLLNILEKQWWGFPFNARYWSTAQRRAEGLRELLATMNKIAARLNSTREYSSELQRWDTLIDTAPDARARYRVIDYVSKVDRTRWDIKRSWDERKNAQLVTGALFPETAYYE